MKRAHRIMWERVNGPIPSGLLVRHKCDNGLCTNPLHLDVGTFKQNSDDKYSRGREGILSGEKQPNAKFTEAQVREIRAKIAAGKKQIELAREYATTKTAIRYAAFLGWKHLA